MHSYRHLIPWFPLSVLLFVFVLLLGTHYNYIPSQQDFLGYTESLYLSWGLPALFVGATLEAIAYVGLYFPGAIIILLSVVVTTGSVSSFFMVTLTVAGAAMLGGCVSYYMGRTMAKRSGILPESTAVTHTGWYVFAHWNLNSLGLWFFKQGFENKPLVPYVITSGLIMLPYGFMWCYILYAFRESFSNENWLALFIIVFGWIMIDIYLKHKKQS